MPPPPSPPSGERSALIDDLERLARVSSGGEGVTRLAWSPELRAAYAWFAERCEEAGLAAQVDPAGNLVARWEAGAAQMTPQDAR